MFHGMQVKPEAPTQTFLFLARILGEGKTHCFFPETSGFFPPCLVPNVIIYTIEVKASTHYCPS